MKKLALGLALIGLIGCQGAAERRLLLLQETQIVLRHSHTDFDFEPERMMLEEHIKEELDGQ